MTTPNPVTELDLEQAFKEDPDFGMRLLYEDFSEVILRYIKFCGWGLSEADRLEILQDTFSDFWIAAQRPEFNHRKPLALAFTIAKRRVIDRLRKKKFTPNSDPDGILEHVARDFRESDIGMQLRHPEGGIDWQEFRQNLHEVIATLPDRQRTVAQVFVDNYAEFRKNDTYGPLAELVSRVTKRPETVVAVKSAWYEAKNKIVMEMTRRGFDFLDLE